MNNCGRFRGFGGGVTRGGYKGTLLASMGQILLMEWRYCNSRTWVSWQYFLSICRFSSSREVCYRGALNDAFTRSNELVIGSLSPSWP